MTAADPPLAPGPSVVPDLAGRLRTARRRFSVEFSPTHDEAAARRQWAAVQRLEDLDPVFASVTYGAGGGRRDGTVELAGRLRRESSLLPLAHVTAVGQSRASLRTVLQDLARQDVREVLALRGDPDGDPEAPWEPHPDGVEHAADLVALARTEGARSVAVAAFPMGHPDSPDLQTDTRHLVGKLRAGADFAVAQLSFDVTEFLRLRDRLAAAGLGDVPLLPGLLPVTSPRVLEVTRRLTGGPEPSWLRERLAGLDEDRAGFRAAGLEVAVQAGRRLLAEGVPVLHLYTLNSARTTVQLVEELGLAG